MKKLLFALGTAALLGACAHNPKGWSVSGTVADADGAKIAIEAYNNGQWYVVDSIAIGPDGKFEYEASEPAHYPDVMRLTLDGRSIYFPVDSIDALTVSTSAAGFGSKYTLSGTQAAASVYTLDSIIASSVASRGAEATMADSLLKDDLFRRAYADTTLISLYYLANKSIGSAPMFSPFEKQGMRVYRTLAQLFSVKRPSDPRGAYLIQRVQEAQLASGSAPTYQIDVPQTSIFDIKRRDASGKVRSLADMASKGHVVILSFTAYGAEGSQPYNLLLNDIYNKYHDAGLDIYQVGLDTDEGVWRNSAVNVPWIAVWNSPTDSSQPLLDYQVGALPMTFIIDRSGAIAARVVDPAELASTLQRYL